MRIRCLSIRLAPCFVLLCSLALLGCTPTPPDRGQPVAHAADSAGVEDAAATLTADAGQDAPPLATATQPQLLGVEPDSGPMGGLQIVTLTGQNLHLVSEVRFGESPALQVTVLDAQTLAVLTPPRPPGLVDVTVVSTDLPDAIAPLAYRYAAVLDVAKVSPPKGPAQGGTAVTVTGKGFTSQTQFSFGDRLAIGVQVLDDQTATMLTPPASGGAVHVAASGIDGQAIAKHAFTYIGAPLLTAVWPSVAAVQASASVPSAVEVEVRGEGLVAKGAVAHWVSGTTELPAEIVHTDSDGRRARVRVPAVYEAGSWDVRWGHSGGVATLPKAFHYVDPAAGAGLVAVTPAAAAVNALQPIVVTLAGNLPAAAMPALKVAIGGVAAQVLAVQHVAGAGASVQVMPPPPAAGTPLPWSPAVSCQISTATLSLAKAFTYLPAVPQILSVKPLIVAPQGGTPMALQLAATQGHGAVVSVRVGALFASQLKPATAQLPGADDGWTALAPPGAPGAADVRVRWADGSEAVLSQAVQFTGFDVTLAAVLPARGARAGGTWVTLLGSGLQRVKQVYFGKAAVAASQAVDSGAMVVRTPVGDPGPVDVVAVLDDGSQRILAKGFTYFDPVAADAGTWGEPIDGAVNVTVLKKGKIGAVEGAVVTLGDDPKSALKGITDTAGQVTLSAKGLRGPLHVHAYKPGWSAASVVAVHVENVTVRLQEFPASSGNGSSPPAEPPLPLPATISGTAIDAGKYTQFPMGSCKGQPTVAGQCQPCGSQDLCSEGTYCEVVRAPLVTLAVAATVTASEAKFCLASCASSDDCLDGFECRAVGSQLSDVRYRCVPRIGKPEVRCEGSSPWIGGGAPPSPQGGVAAADGTFTVNVTPGDSAVICRSGYIDKFTGEFVPLVMGLTRQQFLVPGDHVKGVVVKLNVPLDRTIRVRLDRIPLGSEATGLRRVTAGLRLGAEGYLPVGDASTYLVTDTLVLERQPAPSLWGGDNADLRYELYGGLSQAYGSLPTTVSQAGNLDPRDLDRYARWEPGAVAPQAAGASVGAIRSLADAGELRVAVGERGRILHWTGGTFTQQASPTAVDLQAVWLAPDGKGDGWVGGKQGVLLRRTGLGWQAWPQLLPRDIVALGGRSSDDVWAADSAAQLYHFDGAQWSSVAGPWPAAKPPTKNEPLPPPKQVRALWQSASGTLFLAGDEGALLRATWQPASASLAYEPLASGTWRSLHGLWGSSDSEVWVVGESGFAARFDGKKVTQVATGVSAALLAVRGLGAGLPVDAVGGQGTWLRLHPASATENHSVADLRVDLRGVVPTYDGGFVAAGEPLLVMGPYLEMPFVQVPAGGQSLTGPQGVRRVTWTAKAGLDPTMNLVRLADSSYQTRWEVFVRGVVTDVRLPDFEALGLPPPLPPGNAYVRVWRLYAPGVEIDSYSTKGLSSLGWISWAYTVRSTEEPWLPGPAVPAPLPGPKPDGSPPWLPK